ncbi:hypothetical protein ACYSNR_01960 [Enterococcus sp. LJL128]
MLTSFERLRALLDETNYQVFRNKAPKGTDYPYIVYSFIVKRKKMASSSVFKRLPMYQVSLFTDGTERDLKPIESVFESNQISYSSFASMQGDENDETITQFYTQVRVIENV